jgi:hypothetical protein
MKKIFVFLIISFVLSCSGCSDNTPILSLNYIDWYATTEKINNLTFGYVHLSISGVTTGDKVTVVTYGDGVLSEQELDLDQENKFNQDVIIKFTHTADNVPRIYSTVIIAYKRNSSTKINLESKELVYLE